METQEFIFKEIHLIITIISALGGIIVFMLAKRFSGLDNLILANKGDAEKKIDNLEKKLEREIKDIEKRQIEYEKENSISHKDLYELNKKMEIHFSKIDTKLGILGKKICNGSWVDDAWTLE